MPQYYLAQTIRNYLISPQNVSSLCDVLLFCHFCDFYTDSVPSIVCGMAKSVFRLMKCRFQINVSLLHCHSAKYQAECTPFDKDTFKTSNLSNFRNISDVQCISYDIGSRVGAQLAGTVYIFMPVNDNCCWSELYRAGAEKK